MDTIVNRIESFGVIPVIAIENADNAASLGEALLEGGLPCAEITFRTQAAVESIRLLAMNFPEILLGAGTVLNVKQAQKAIENGARFLVTPGFDEAVVTWSLAKGVPIFPGVATPTEINLAMQHGLNILKFFPAEAMGGVKTLKAIAAPYGDIRFIPTGGINPQNLTDYLSLPAVVACGGSWLVTKSLIANGEFQAIVQLVRSAMDLVQKIRSR